MFLGELGSKVERFRNRESQLTARVSVAVADVVRQDLLRGEYSDVLAKSVREGHTRVLQTSEGRRAVVEIHVSSAMISQLTQLRDLDEVRANPHLMGIIMQFEQQNLALQAPSIVTHGKRSIMRL